MFLEKDVREHQSTLAKNGHKNGRKQGNLINRKYLVTSRFVSETHFVVSLKPITLKEQKESISLREEINLRHS